MELIERYLHAVRQALPKAEQDDITKELRDSILSQVEEKEAALGRPLNEDEQVELLKRLGSPMRLASRYRKQQYLIGATLFPIYWKVLKIALGLAFLVIAASSVAMAASGKSLLECLSVLLRYPNFALTVFGWVTLVFAAMEFFGARFGDRFDPRKLPALDKPSTMEKSRFELIAELAAKTIFGVWWLVGLHYQFLVLGPGVAFLNFGPVWHSLYRLFVIAVLFDIGRTLMKLYRPNWRGHRIGDVIMRVYSFVVIFFLVNAPELFVPTNTNSPEMQTVVKNINFATHLGLMVALIVLVITTIVGAARLVGKKLSQAHQATVGSL